MIRKTTFVDRAATAAVATRPLAWLMLAASTWACSPVPGPSAGTEAGVPSGAPTTGEATSSEGTSGPVTAEPTAAPTTSALPADGPVPDAACASCLSGKVSWGWVGGNAFQRDRSTAEPCRVYRRTRTFSARGGGQPPISCAAQLACDGSDTGSGKLATLMSHPDVQKALASPMTVYGCDMRAVDGTLYGVEVDGGRSFGVGGECKECSAPSGKCVSPPAAVKELVAFLQKVDERMLAVDPCKSALGSP